MINIIPKPNHLVIGNGSFVFKQGMTINAPTQSEAASLLESKLLNAAGIRLESVSDKNKAEIALCFDSSFVHTSEGYELIIATNQITIKATTETGLYYAVQTLLQLLPPQIESSHKVSSTWEVPCLTISDAPRFSYRGIMLDACRHFISVDHLKRLLDVFAMNKINKFHWHLTDDQGWRIEIKRYPRLTQIGSTRTEADGKQYSGFYTQNQIKEIVSYASARHIEIIPEIEMPGHALAALAAYPQYSCNGIPLSVRSTWGVEKNVFCAGNDSIYFFLSNILNEVCTLFPSSYIHIGGDECPKDNWKKCLKCQASMKENGLKTEDDLQSYFVKRISKFLEQKGKKVIVWEENLGDDFPKSTTIMSWRGDKGGIDAINAGQDVILTPTSTQYLDFYQGSPLCESVKIEGLTTLQQVYSYNPIQDSKNPLLLKHILGVQGNLWSEYLIKPELFDYQLFPRLIAVAEVGWTQPKNKDVNEFIKRTDNMLIRLDEHEIKYYVPMPEGNFNYMMFTDSLNLPFTTNRPTKLVYTMDGSMPTINSTIYTEPIRISKTTVLKLRSVLPNGKMSEVRALSLTKTTPMNAVSDSKNNFHSGLHMKFTTKGIYKDVAELHVNKDWEDSIVNDINDFFKIKSLKETYGAAIFTGKILIDKDSDYIFRCYSDQLFIDDILLINNNGQNKKNAVSDIVVPIKAGYHSVKIILINRTIGGVPSSTIDSQILIQPFEMLGQESKWKRIQCYY